MMMDEQIAQRLRVRAELVHGGRSELDGLEADGRDLFDGLLVLAAPCDGGVAETDCICGRDVRQGRCGSDDVCADRADAGQKAAPRDFRHVWTPRRARNEAAWRSPPRRRAQ